MAEKKDEEVYEEEEYEEESEDEDYDEEELEEGEDEDTLEGIARKLGWKPKEEFDEDDRKDFVDAKTFLLKGGDIQDSMRQTLKEQKKLIENQGQKIEGLYKGIDDLKQHNERVYKAENDRLKSQIEDLKARRKEAIEEGEAEKVEELDTQIDTAKDKLKESEKKPDEEESEEFSEEDQEVFSDWYSKNSWYGESKEMRQYAQVQADSDSLAGLTLERRLNAVTRRVKDAFPEYFESKKQPAKGNAPPGGPESGGPKRRTPKKPTRRDVPSDLRPIMDNFVKQGIMTEDEYITDLQKEGVI